jgi:hypothetical protein
MGIEVIAAIRERPRSRFRHDCARLCREMPGLANVVCLQKPFRPNDLLQALKSAQAGRLQTAV